MGNTYGRRTRIRKRSDCVPIFSQPVREAYKVAHSLGRWPLRALLGTARWNEREADGHPLKPQGWLLARQARRHQRDLGVKHQVSALTFDSPLFLSTTNSPSH